jgi:hypothetical protein
MDAHPDLPPFHSVAEHSVGDVICFPGSQEIMLVGVCAGSTPLSSVSPTLRRLVLEKFSDACLTFAEIKVLSMPLVHA